MTNEPRSPLGVDDVPVVLDDITLIEMKTTAKPIQNVSLAGYFFGTSETQYNLADVAGPRLKWAFVVMNDQNDYGRPFFALLSTGEVRKSTRTRRVQFQVNFKTSDMPGAPSRDPLPDPDFVTTEVRHS